MKIRFQFNLRKATQVMAFFLKNGPVDKAKLMKLVYLSDREHFVRTGIPITGDKLVAMPLGPVPSKTLNAVNGDLFPVDASIFDFIHVDDFRVQLRSDPGADQLDAEELKTLEQVQQQFGNLSTWALVRRTHKLPEYEDCYVENSSRPIPFERIAKHSGNPERYDLDRAVVTPAMAEKMNCPFPPDHDL